MRHSIISYYSLQMLNIQFYVSKHLAYIRSLSPNPIIRALFIYENTIKLYFSKGWGVTGGETMLYHVFEKGKWFYMYKIQTYFETKQP